MTSLRINNDVVEPGQRAELELRAAQLPSGGWMSMPLIAINGAHDGPTMWLTAAIHGDEVNGVEIIHQVLDVIDPAELRGVLLACPVVNVPGFAVGDRYFPDRRDLNRSFPGSARGSLTSRFAQVLMRDVIGAGDVGIDLHTGSDHRTNLPQIRADLDDPHTCELADVFGAPLALHSRVRDGSLREAAVRRGITTLLYEGGQAWRFDEDAIRVGVEGVLRVMNRVGLRPDVTARPAGHTRLFRKSRWVRAPRSGVTRMLVDLGDIVEPRQPLAEVADAYGGERRVIRAREASIVIARLEQPVVHRGDALVHLAPLESETSS